MDGVPSPGDIIMGTTARTKRAYRILTVKQALRGRLLSIGDGEYAATWHLTVEPMSAARGREEIAAGAPSWSLVWDKRNRRRPQTCG